MFMNTLNRMLNRYAAYCLVVICFAWSVPQAQCTPLDYISDGTGVFAYADAMTLDPSDTHSMAGVGDNYNFGAAGSISIASSIAYAYSEEENINEDPKGLYRAVMKFNTSIFESTDIADLSLSLYTNNGNAGARGLFNIRGCAGDVDVYWIVNDWIEGDGLPLGAKSSYSDDYTTDPITDNSLDALLSETEAVKLASFTYDGLAEYGTLAWYTWSLAEALENADFAAALYSGREISLLFTPGYVDENGDGVNDNTVSFNLISHRSESEGAILSYTAVPEPASLALLGAASVALLRRRVRL